PSTNDSLAEFVAVASSADGSKLAVAENGSSVYTSTDSGVTWTQHATPPHPITTIDMASSSDGTVLVAVPDLADYLFVSTDSGTTWARAFAVGYWRSAACSSDGSKIVAGLNFSGPGSGGFTSYICTSADSGLTWVAQPNAPTNSIRSLASSADGNRLIAGTSGLIYISTNSGVNWTAQVNGVGSSGGVPGAGWPVA